MHRILIQYYKKNTNEFIHFKKNMTERKAWTQQQDDALKYLYEVEKIRSWASISQALKTRFGVQFRNGKQCRQRYYNHLDQDISKKNWTFKEDKLLLQLHHRYGNSWTKIAQQLSGRSDNCIKNHFYSQLRKGLKIVNLHIKSQQLENLQPFRLNFFMKVFKIAEIKKVGRKKLPTLATKCREIRDKIMSFVLRSEYLNENQPVSTQLSQLVFNIQRIKQNVIKFRNGQKEQQYIQEEQHSYHHNEKNSEKNREENDKMQKQICTLTSLQQSDSLVFQLEDLPIRIDDIRLSQNSSEDFDYKYYEDEFSDNPNILEVQYFDTLKFLSDLQ